MSSHSPASDRLLSWSQAKHTAYRCKGSVISWTLGDSEAFLRSFFRNESSASGMTYANHLDPDGKQRWQMIDKVIMLNLNCCYSSWFASFSRRKRFAANVRKMKSFHLWSVGTESVRFPHLHLEWMMAHPSSIKQCKVSSYASLSLLTIFLSRRDWLKNFREALLWPHTCLKPSPSFF